MMLIRGLLLFFGLSSVAQATTYQYYDSASAASAACSADRGGLACQVAGTGPASWCQSGTYVGYTYSSSSILYIGCSGSAGSTCAHGKVLQINGSCQCPAGQAWNGSQCVDQCPVAGQSYINGVCTCPTGQIEYNAQCIDQPPDCSAGEITTACSNTICIGQYSPSFSCWLPSASAPQGCESGYKTFSGCDLVCPGDSTPNAEGTACDDPTCPSGQAIANHVCYPTPTCGDGYVAEFNDANSSFQCQFAGCPSGMVQGKIDGSTVCVASGDTTKGTMTPDPAGSSTTIQTGPDGTITTTEETTVNPDGTVTTTTTQTTSAGTTTTTRTGTVAGTEISLDTAGLAQESTTREGVEATKELRDLVKGDGNVTANEYQAQYDGTGVPSYSDTLTLAKTRLSNAPIGEAATGFFTVEFAGSCPIWELPATELTPSILIDQFCSEALTQVWPWISVVLLAVATYAAFMIAFM